MLPAGAGLGKGDGWRRGNFLDRLMKVNRCDPSRDCFRHAPRIAFAKRAEGGQGPIRQHLATPSPLAWEVRESRECPKGAVPCRIRSRLSVAPGADSGRITAACWR